MTWNAEAVQQAEVTPEYLFKIGKRHKLLSENITDSIDYYRNLAGSCRVIEIKDGGDTVAHLIVSNIVDGDSADVDFVPRPKNFITGSGYEEQMQDVVTPVLRGLMTMRSLRRLTAMIPKSRNRTCNALRSVGFEKEGVMRDAICLIGDPPAGGVQDVVIMGLLAKKE